MVTEIISKGNSALREHFKLINLLAVNLKFWLILGIDIVLIILSIYTAHAIRYENAPHGLSIDKFLGVIPLLLVVKISFFYAFGLYRGMWRYTSTRDLFNILQACLCAVLTIIAFLLYLNRFEGLSRSVFILDTVFTFLLIAGHRVAIRYYYRNTSGARAFVPTSGSQKKLTRLLLVGAGDAAEKTIREIKDNPNLSYCIVGLVDDDPKKTGMKVHGIPVLGQIDDLPVHVDRVHANKLLITISSVSGENMKRIISRCQDSSVPFKVLPGMGEIIDGKIAVKEMREIDYRDLLGRDEVHLDQNQIGQYLTGNIVLVTGAGGSIGSELCRQIVNFRPEKIILFDASEENLYNMQMEFIHEFHFKDIEPILGKIQDIPLLNKVFLDYKPQVVFHAAAYKHVPLLERNSWQAVDNNIIGTQMVIEAAIIHKVRRFVIVSTDKAVRPTNVMGASKRVTELLMHAYSSSSWDGYLSQYWEEKGLEAGLAKVLGERQHKTIFMAVRFGNVLGSSGSVIPLFKKQIQKGGPITVTHPDITRYFMSIEEAAQLIVQAGSMGEGGEIFILKMGEPIKIAQMAKELIKLAGKEPEVDIDIVYTGLRDGEKLYEELITEGEGIVATNHTKIMVLKNAEDEISCKQLHQYLISLGQGAIIHDKTAIKTALQNTVPEFVIS